MCFSLTASVTAGTVLIVTGLIAIASANRRLSLFAAIPVFFGIQQLIEGMVWHGLNTGHYYLIHYASFGFLFFAFFFWPFYIPLSVYVIEPNKYIKKILLLFVVTGALLGADLYLPIIFKHIQLTTDVMKHSIDYDTYQHEPLLALHVIAYVAIVVMSLCLSSFRLIKIFGVLIFISAAISLYIYEYVFTSVWCFFAAILSVYIVYATARLKNHPNLPLAR